MAFNAYLIDRLAAKRAEHPNENLRQIRLRVAQDFWSVSNEEKAGYEDRANIEQERIENFLESLEENEENEYDVPGVGILVRTDFTNNDAWNSFVVDLREAEKELLTESGDSSNTADGTDSTIAVDGAEAESEPESDEDGDVEMQGAATNGQTHATNGNTPSPPSIFTLVNPSETDPLRAQVSNASNLKVLRVFNDVSVKRALSPPQGTSRVRGNRLIDCDGYVEVYEGNIVWIYDGQSNADRSVRLVSQRGEVYGAATGDSWRPRVSFLPELQINLFTGAIKIDFGGIDRWDYRERRRNIAEVESSLP